MEAALFGPFIHTVVLMQTRSLFQPPLSESGTRFLGWCSHVHAHFRQSKTFSRTPLLSSLHL